MTLDLTSDIPIYAQIKNAVIAGIASGELHVGHTLPSVRQLASDVGVNMQTVNKAYALLRQEGYIEIHRRKGAVIAEGIGADAGSQKKMVRDLQIIAREAISRNMGRQEFIGMCEEAYTSSKGGV